MTERVRKLGPGIYDDGRGGLHVYVEDVIKELGLEDTPEQRRAIEEGVRLASASAGVPTKEPR